MNMYRKLLLVVLSCITPVLPTKCQKDIPEPYKSTVCLPLDCNAGWFAFANRRMLEQFIKTRQPATVVEIGTWLGASAVFMGKLLPENGKLYAVDHWMGSAEHQKDAECKKMLRNMYQQFLSNVKHYHLEHTIVPVRMSSLEAAEALAIPADLIYIDGSHDPVDVYNDIMAWYPKLNKGGIICGDDYMWGNQKLGFVYEGVQKAAAELGLSIYVEENVFWYAVRKN